MRMKRSAASTTTGTKTVSSGLLVAVTTALVGAVVATVVAFALPDTSHAASPACGQPASPVGFASYRSTAGYTRALRTYDDAIEDSGNSPDFCAAEFITNDNRVITIGIHAHNRSGFVAGDTYGVYLDTDSNPTTGGGGVGAEFEVVFDSPLGQLERWDGTTFEASGAQPVPVLWVPDYGPVLVLLRSFIGNLAGFNAVFVSSNGADTDRAPDTGSWTYAVQPFALKVKSLALSPARAGHLFAARAVVLGSDFDAPVDEGRIACTARASGRAIRGKGRFAHSRVICTWRLPARARGKRLSGVLSVVDQGARTARPFAVRVR
jgi:hypothetical protein